MIDLFFECGLPIIYIVAKILLITLPLLLCVAYLTYAERRVIGLMQIRRGPNVVGPFGLLQPIADAVKLMFKEVIVPTPANKVVFILAPMITFILSLIGLIWSFNVENGLHILGKQAGLLIIPVSFLFLNKSVCPWSSSSERDFIFSSRALTLSR